MSSAWRSTGSHSFVELFRLVPGLVRHEAMKFLRLKLHRIKLLAS